MRTFVRHVTLSIQDDDGRPLVSRGVEMVTMEHPDGHWTAFVGDQYMLGEDEVDAITALLAEVVSVR